MTKTCPDCGAEIEYTAQPGVLLTGRCGACGQTIALLESSANGTAGLSGDGPTPSPAVTAEGPARGRRSAPDPMEGPACGSCGSAMEIQSASGQSIKTKCPDCGAAFTYVPSPPPEARARPARAWREDDRGASGPRATRPCRVCGAPLRFSTSEDGTISGECTSCGNRFTLPPRREGGRGSSGGYRGGDRDRGPPRGFRPGGFRPRTPGGRDRRGGPPRRFSPSRGGSGHPEGERWNRRKRREREEGEHD